MIIDVDGKLYCRTIATLEGKVYVYTLIMITIQ